MMSASSRFEYVIYIRTTADELWHGLTAPEMTRQYWYEAWQDCESKVGAPWRLMIPGDRVGDAGEVLEIEPGKRLVVSWRNEFVPEMREEGYSRCSFVLEPHEGAM